MCGIKCGNLGSSINLGGTWHRSASLSTLRTMTPLYLVTGSIQYALYNRSLDQPQVGDILLRKLDASSAVDYSLYEGPEDFSMNLKTWLIKVLSCPVRFQDQASEVPEGAVRRMKCMILYVWEHGHGFKEALGGGLMAPEVPPVASSPDPPRGQGSNWPSGNCIAMCFTQPLAPLGPIFLRVDFWKDDYFDEAYAKLGVLAIDDSLCTDNGELRTITSWRRVEESWICGGSVSGRRIQNVNATVSAVHV